MKITNKEFRAVNYEILDLMYVKPKCDFEHIWNAEVCKNRIDENGKVSGIICETVSDTTYPYNTIEEGVSLGSEVDLVRQGVFLLKQENDLLIFGVKELETDNQLLKDELCKKDSSYSWCLSVGELG